jgi:hypothetical protein
MKKIFKIIWPILRGFFINPFWEKWPIVVGLGLSLAINGILWYIYAIKIKHNPVPIEYASGLIIINLILANYLYLKEKLASIFLIYSALFIQILMLIFIRFIFIVI